MSSSTPPHGYNDPRQGGYGQQPQGGYGQYPQGGQPGYDPSGYGAGYGTPAGYGQGTPRRGGRGGKVAFFIGVVMLVLGAVGAIAGGSMLYSGILGNVDLTSGGLPNSFTTSTVLDASEGTQYLLMAIEPQGTPSCQVTAPDGSAVPISTEVSQTTSSDGVTATVVGYFEAATAGSHDLTCQGAMEFAYLQFDVSSLLTSTVLLVGGILLGIAGFIVALIGLIVWLSGRNKYTWH